MQRKIWFRAKNYGWGWYPCTWQGWAILAIWLTLGLIILRTIDMKSNSVSGTLLDFFIPFALLIALIILIGYGIGEKPRWRWGK